MVGNHFSLQRLVPITIHQITMASIKILYRTSEIKQRTRFSGVAEADFLFRQNKTVHNSDKEDIFKTHREKLFRTLNADDLWENFSSNRQALYRKQGSAITFKDHMTKLKGSADYELLPRWLNSMWRLLKGKGVHGQQTLNKSHDLTAKTNTNALNSAVKCKRIR